MEDFEIIGEIATGCCSTVLEVKEKSQDVKFALKTITFMKAFEDGPSAFHYTEARNIMTQIDSPWITRAEFCFHDDFGLRLVTELNHGCTLQHFFKVSEKPLFEKVVRIFASEISEALHVLHGHRYMHGNLNPSNVMIDIHGHIKLGGFGHALKLDQSDQAVGKFALRSNCMQYMSPEIIDQCQQNRSNGSPIVFSASDDWWSLGSIIVELLAGVNLFQGDTDEATCRKVLDWTSMKKLLHIRFKNLPSVHDFVTRLVTSRESRMTYADVVNHPWMANIDFENLRSNVVPIHVDMLTVNPVTDFVPAGYMPDGEMTPACLLKRYNYAKTLIGFAYNAYLADASKISELRMHKADNAVLPHTCQMMSEFAEKSQKILDELKAKELTLKAENSCLKAELKALQASKCENERLLQEANEGQSKLSASVSESELSSKLAADIKEMKRIDDETVERLHQTKDPLPQYRQRVINYIPENQHMKRLDSEEPYKQKDHAEAENQVAIDQYQSQIVEMQNHLDEGDECIVRMKLENDALQLQVKSQNAMVPHQQAKIAELCKENAMFFGMLEELHHQCDDLLMLKDSYKEQLIASSTKLQHVQCEADIAQQQLTEIQKQLKEAEGKRAEMHKRMLNYEEKLFAVSKDYSDELRKISAECDFKSEENSNLAFMVTKLNQSLQERQNQLMQAKESKSYQMQRIQLLEEYVIYFLFIRRFQWRELGLRCSVDFFKFWVKLFFYLVHLCCMLTSWSTSIFWLHLPAAVKNLCTTCLSNRVIS
ncbi:unnamed protein product [Soboliphyme baturini]|uniref:Serine/threonine-protein kinase greatwall n=1 Tax=Soboliphyme baturini TaxID=241478 RepID=A0A183II56_9BILA|nr:unnamed protein product [Soboliphyme baturini]